MAMLARRASSSTADRAARISWYFCLNITFSLLEKSVQFMFIIVSYAILFKHQMLQTYSQSRKNARR